MKAIINLCIIIGMLACYLVVTGIFGYLSAFMSDDEDLGPIYAWVFGAILFVVVIVYFMTRLEMW